MGWTATLMAGGTALMLLALAARMSGRRRLDRWSLLPWNQLLLLAAIGLLAVLARAAVLWRDGWPLPWTGG